MLLGPLSKSIVPSLVIDHNSIERVCGFKLLGVHISERKVIHWLKAMSDERDKML